MSFASQTLRPDIFHDTGITPIKNESGKTLYESTSDLESLRKEHPEWSEEASVHEVLKTIITKSKENANIPSLYEKCYANSQQMVYPFKNVYDETGMKVVKLYDFDNSTAKCFIPTTTWMRSGSIKNQLFAVPCSQRSQPLYNLNLLSKEETTLDKAKEFINSKPREWWEEHVASSEEQRLVKEEFNQSSTIDYILRPFLIRGEATMLFAGKSTGKSALALSIAAAITSSSSKPKPLFKEKWWTVPKSNYKRHKVLYLDFENGQNEIASRIKKFADSYWPQNKEEHKKCSDNLLIEDMGRISDTPDYSSPAYHQRIIDMIEAGKDKGEKGQPVDLLVIDTYTKFVKAENPQTSSNFAAFIDKVRKMGIAILILHHENDEGKIRGQKTKLDSLYATFRLYREKATGAESLDTPMKLKFCTYRGHLNETLKSEFKIKFDNETNKWQVYEPERDEKTELKPIVEFYEKGGFKRPAIAQMLGMSKSSLFDKLDDK